MVEENKVLGNDDTTNLNENLVNEEEQININLQADENLQVNNDLQKDVEEFVKKNKKSSLKKILFGLIVFLLLLIVIGVILFLLGFFTHEEKKEEIKPLEQKQEMTKKEEESYKFDIKDINSKKLNRNKKPVIGWVGDYGNGNEIEKDYSHKSSLTTLLFPALTQLNFEIKLVLIGIKEKADIPEIKTFFESYPHIELEIPEDLGWENDLWLYDKIKDFDIGVSPMLDFEFNRAKSAFSCAAALNSNSSLSLNGFMTETKEQ